MNRRKFLGSIALATSATVVGCIGETEATALEQADGSAMEISTEKESPAENVYTVSANFEDGEFDGMEVWSQTTYILKWSLEVTKGGPIDVWVMDLEELESFREKGDISYSREVSKMGVTSGNASGSMPHGKYMILFENSGAYKTEPEGPVEFEATVTQSFG